MKKYSILAVAAIISLSFTSASFAEGSNTENSVTGFFKRLFNYPVKATQGTVQTTGNTLSNTGEKVLSNTGENIAEGKVAEAIAQPVVGTVETVGQTVSETAQIPVKSAEEGQA